MFTNYLKIAFRNLWRNKIFTTINILGLAIGITTCLLILLFVQHELSYDRFHAKADRMVRVVFKGDIQGEKLSEAHVMPPVAQTLLADYPEVEEATRLRKQAAVRISYDNQLFRDDFAFVDANFFQVFTLPFLKGDPLTALAAPNTVVISQAAAQKYFGSEEPIGKILHFKDQQASCKVTGVLKNMPATSHFRFDIFVSMAGLPDAQSSSWMSSEYFTYLVLPEGYDFKQLEAKLPQVVEKYMGPQIQQAIGLSLEQFREKGNDIGLFLQPLTSIHMHSEMLYELAPKGDMRYVYIFSAIAVFMLLIACINFMNLSTASASKRAREVGVRKVLGSVKGDLVKQFLVESVLLSMLALLIGVMLVDLALPFFNQLAEKQLSLDFASNRWLLPLLLLFGLLVGVLAGSYPAFFLSSFKPVAVLKGQLHTGKESLKLRSGLVVFQFFISTILIISTTVVYQQLHFIQHKELGYDKEQVLVLPETWLLGEHVEAFRQELLQDPRVLSVSTSGYLPAGPSYNNNFFVFPGDDASRQIKTLRYDVDEHYIPTLGIEIIAGRNFSRAFGSDSMGVILNEAAAKAFGWEDNAVGQTITAFVHNDGGRVSYRVIGVVKDFHFRSMHEHISPLVMVAGKDQGAIIVKAQTEDMAGLLAAMQSQWKKFNEEEPFAYTFMDERFNQIHQAEQRLGMILGIFAGLTIMVACLGLFGLAAFTAEQRTKEIGIRKVLGASVANVVTLISKDFIKLVLIANLLAWPLAWYVMRHWLNDFAYRIELSWWMFALAGLLALLIALLTVSWQSIKAALANPVKSLRSE